MNICKIPTINGVLSVSFSVCGADESTGYSGEISIESITYTSRDGKHTADFTYAAVELDDVVGNELWKKLEDACKEAIGKGEDVQYNPMED